MPMMKAALFVEPGASHATRNRFPMSGHSTPC